MTLEELENNFEINKHTLDDECNKQTHLFYEACKGWASAVDKRDTAKHRLQVISAQIACAFRVNALEKVTEAKVTEHVESHPDYIAQLQFIDQYSNETNLWIGMKEAYEGRRWMLIEMSKQQQIGWFGSGLNAMDDMKEAMISARRKAGEINGK